jgi:hypothetical protein
MQPVQILVGHSITGGLETVPFGPEDIQQVRAALADVSERRSCRVLGVGRAALHRRSEARPRPAVEPPWSNACGS